MTTPDDLVASDLATLVQRGWDLHASHPAEVAAALRARAATLGDDGADAIGLAEHVFLSHLDDGRGLRDFVSALPPALAAAPGTAPALARTRWVLAMVEGAPAEPPPDPLRWRGLQNVWAAWAAHGRAGEARAMLAAELPVAAGHADPAARRALAATCNNLAVDLRCGARGDAQRDLLMIELAEGSRTLWSGVGTWVHVERADYQLARCHAARGDGTAALRHARAAIDAIDAHAGDPQADAFERFFAHEALAWARHALGDAAAAAAEHARMSTLLAEVRDPDLQAWCREALQALDAAVRAPAGAAPA